MISKDKKVFEEKSTVRARMLEYSDLFDGLHVAVFGKTGGLPLEEKVTHKFFLYSPSSNNIFFIFLKTLGAAFKVGKKIKSENNAWISSQDPFETGLIAFIISKLCGLKFQIQIHTDFLSPYFNKESFLNRLRGFIAKRILPSADSIRVVSSRIKESLSTLNFKLSTIHVLPVFVDIEAIKSQKITSDLRKKFPEFNKIILVASRLEKEKNIFLALDAFKLILETKKDAGLVVAGEGSLRNELEDYAKKIGIIQNVRFLGWQDNIISLYKTADFLLVTSFYEGYGMSIVEALASECRVVSTDVGIAHETGAEIVTYDSEEISKKAIDVLSMNKKIINLQILKKEEYLNKFKQTFLPTKNL